MGVVSDIKLIRTDTTLLILAKRPRSDTVPLARGTLSGGQIRHQSQVHLVLMPFLLQHHLEGKNKI